MINIEDNDPAKTGIFYIHSPAIQHKASKYPTRCFNRFIAVPRKRSQ